MKVSKPSTVRNSIVNQSLNTTDGKLQQSEQKEPQQEMQGEQMPEAVERVVNSSVASKANSTQKSRSRSKKSGKGTKWLSKEVAGNGGIRIRKVQIQGKGTSSASAVSTLAQLSKSAQGKQGGFNLLTSVKDRKGQHQ